MKVSWLLAGEICPGDKFFTENFFHEKYFSFLWLLLLLLLYTNHICLEILLEFLVSIDG